VLVVEVKAEELQCWWLMYGNEQVFATKQHIFFPVINHFLHKQNYYTKSVCGDLLYLVN